MNIKKALWFTEKFTDYAKKLKELGIEIYAPDFLLKKIETRGLFEPLSSLGLSYHSGPLEISIVNEFDLFVVNIPEQKPLWSEDELLERIETSFSILVKLAVKNYKNAIVAADEEALNIITDNIKRCGDVPLQDRRKLSLKAILRLIIYYAELYEFLSQAFASEKFHYILLDKIQPLKYDRFSNHEAELLKLHSHHSFFEDIEFINFEGLPTLDDVLDIHEGMNIVKELPENSCVLVSYGAVRCIANSNNLMNNIRKIIKYKKHFEIPGSIILRGKIDNTLLDEMENAGVQTVVAEEFVVDRMSKSVRMVKVRKFQLDDQNYVYKLLGSTVIKYETDKSKRNKPVVVNNVKITPHDEEALDFILNILKNLKPSSAILTKGKETLYLSTRCSSAYESIDNVMNQLNEFSENLKKTDNLILAMSSIPSDEKSLDKIKELGVKILCSLRICNNSELIKKLENNGIALFQPIITQGGIIK